MQIMSFGVAGVRFGISIDDVQSIGNMPEITFVPNAPSYITGIIMQEGKVIPVYNLMEWFQYERNAGSRDEKLIIVNVNGDKAAFPIQELYGIQEVGQDHIRDLPDMLHSDNSITQNIADSEGKLIVMLDIPRLMAVSGYESVREITVTA